MVKDARNVDTSDSFKETINNFRWTEELGNEEWLATWLNNPNSIAAFEQNFPIIKQIDQVIR